MIEITERIATAINSAVKILEVEDFHQPLGWVRSVNVLAEVSDIIRVDCIFWIDGNPNTRRNVSITITRSIPTSAILSDPNQEDQKSFWDFDFSKDHNPVKRLYS